MFLLFFSVTMIYGQECNPYFPIQVGNYWNYEGYGSEGTSSYSLQMHIDVAKDTVINGKLYYILNYVENLVPSVKYFRTDANTDVYSYSKEDTTEYLLYKFSGVPYQTYYSNKTRMEIVYKNLAGMVFQEGFLVNDRRITFIMYNGLYSISGQHYSINIDPQNFRVLNNCETSSIEYHKNNYERIQLRNNYPNPFNPGTKIQYSIPEDGLVKLKVFDLLGREVKTLINENKKSGNYEAYFDASGLASGIYFYSLQVNDFVESKKMIYLR
jgi:hypothetical protein